MKADFNNTAVIVPVYNGADFLPELINRIGKICTRQQIFMVNDGSQDGTSTILRDSGVELIEFIHNRGKGAALQAGFTAALDRGFRFAVTLDADLQHPPELFPVFLEVQNREDADLVIGRRAFRPGVMPILRICSNSLTSGIVSLLSGQRIPDSQSGYRLYNLEVMKGMDFYSERFQFETEVILKFGRRKRKIVSLEIPVIYHGQESHISHFRDIANFIQVVLRELVTAREKIE